MVADFLRLLADPGGFGGGLLNARLKNDQHYARSLLVALLQSNAGLLLRIVNIVGIRRPGDIIRSDFVIAVYRLGSNATTSTLSVSIKI